MRPKSLDGHVGTAFRCEEPEDREWPLLSCGQEQPGCPLPQLPSVPGDPKPPVGSGAVVGGPCLPTSRAWVLA